MLRVAVAHQRDAVLVTEAEPVDPKGRRIVYVNSAFTAMTGFSAKEAIGRTPGLTVGQLTDPKAIERIQAAIEAKTAVRQEILKYRKDGSTFWAELDIAPVLRDDGRASHFVAVMRDVSEKKRQTELVRDQAAALERALSAKSLFLANVSHELRTPLNAILGYANLLLSGVNGTLSTAQRRSIARVDSNGRHLLQVINEILDITRIESGRLPLKLSRFDVRALLDEVLAEHEPLIAGSKLDVKVKVPRTLPTLRTDRQKVKQIVLNLLSNAVKFTQRGFIRVEVKNDARHLEIAVEDSGVGIAPEHQARVFEDFWQVDDTPTRRVGGTGLGLSICRRLATTLDGEITLKSEVGRGSRFTLRLPRVKKRGR